MLSLQHNWRRRGQNRFYLQAEEVGWGEEGRWHTMCTHVSKCKNDKRKGEKKKKDL
jgi:hypothetical protein